jgi:hypothetical protein
MLPVFLSTPDTDIRDGLALPFKFVGGFGLTTKQVGFILTLQGVYSMVSTLILFPIAVRRLGTLNLFRLLAFSYPALYLITPYVVVLPHALRYVGLALLIVWKCTFSTWVFPAMAILLANSAPSLLLLGTINGAAASTASFCRALGPTFSGILFSAGLRIGYSGLSWWCSAVVAVFGALVSVSMTDKAARTDLDEDSDSDDEECCIGAGSDEPTMSR